MVVDVEENISKELNTNLRCIFTVDDTLLELKRGGIGKRPWKESTLMDKT